MDQNNLTEKISAKRGFQEEELGEKSYSVWKDLSGCLGCLGLIILAMGALLYLATWLDTVDIGGFFRSENVMSEKTQIQSHAGSPETQEQSHTNHGNQKEDGESSWDGNFWLGLDKKQKTAAAIVILVEADSSILPEDISKMITALDQFYTSDPSFRNEKVENVAAKILNKKKR